MHIALDFRRDPWRADGLDRAAELKVLCQQAKVHGSNVGSRKDGKVCMC